MEAINKTTHIPLFKVGEEVLIAPQVTNEKEWFWLDSSFQSYGDAYEDE